MWPFHELYLSQQLDAVSVFVTPLCHCITERMDWAGLGVLLTEHGLAIFILTSIPSSIPLGNIHTHLYSFLYIANAGQERDTYCFGSPLLCMCRASSAVPVSLVIFIVAWVFMLVQTFGIPYNGTTNVVSWVGGAGAQGQAAQGGGWAGGQKRGQVGHREGGAAGEWGQGCGYGYSDVVKLRGAQQRRPTESGLGIMLDKGEDV